jgi:hypothetical protein
MKYRELIKKVQDYSGFSDAESQEALEMMVESLAVHLTEGERKDFASQLPQKLKDMALSVYPSKENSKEDLVEQFMEYEHIDENRAQAAFDPAKGGHVGQNGKNEALLTGDTAEKVKAAALAAYPGGTIQRVETDAEGAAYEAHMAKADGTQINVKFDNNFKVTGTETGGPAGQGGPRQDSENNT